jgi:hypothetical protein
MTWMRIMGWIGIAAACVAISAHAQGQPTRPGAPGDALSGPQIAGVAALARAAALVRYLHPSDQAAALDWNAFLPAAVDRVLRTRDPAAPVVALIDGQSSSTVETTLAMIRDHHLGLLVGEPTAGTSGLISHVAIPGGYVIRFTAIRMVDAAGATLHGRGIAPDVVVHPTLEGVRAGRDEVLEAGLAAAQRLTAGAAVLAP